MWHIIQSSNDLYHPPETIAQFKFRWIAELYKILNYDILAEPSWRRSFDWHVIHDKDLP